jgi:PST family polysaccharide transporter
MNAIWIKYLPKFLRGRLAHRHTLQEILGNTSWLLAERIVRMTLGLTVGVWVARHLGPDQYGLLSYVLALSALFAPIGALGLDRILVHDLVRHPQRQSESIGTAFYLRLCASSIAFFAATMTAWLVRPDAAVVTTMTAIISLGIVFQSFDVIRLWFESRVRAKYVAIAQSCALVLSSATKVLLIVNNAPLRVFAWTFLLEATITSLVLLIAYRKNEQRLRSWRPRLDRARSMLKDSWPLLLSALATGGAQMRIGQIMLGHMVSDQATGTFAAGTRLSELWFFLPMIVVASISPAITQAKERGNEIYYDRLRRSLRVLALSGIALALATSLLAPYFISILFGADYAGAAAVLRIHAWSIVFVFLGVGVTPWIVNENCLSLAMWRSVVAITVDIALNLILIPLWGPVGAAVSAVCGWFVGFVLLNAFRKKTRVIFWIQLQACLPIGPRTWRAPDRDRE